MRKQTRPPKPCKHTGCGYTTRSASGWCPDHAPAMPVIRNHRGIHVFGHQLTREQAYRLAYDIADALAEPSPSRSERD